ncbi:MAG: hypothetical protein KC589_06375 [Nanoarchaeota archaeon]|nr:hypothetical protein [Nanoarchaeota archaeon]
MKTKINHIILNLILIIFCIFFFINNTYSFSQSYTSPPTPTNNSIINTLNTNIQIGTTGSENTSTIFNWDNSLVGYWNFENVSGTTVYDNSGNNNNGTLINGVSINNTNRIRGNYSDYNGSNYLLINDSTILQPKNITYGLWINILGPGTHSDGNHILTKSRSGAQPYFSYTIAHIPSSQKLRCNLGISGT